MVLEFALLYGRSCWDIYQLIVDSGKRMEAEDGKACKSEVRDALEVLEKQRKLMVEMPEVELDENTKRLRQACFKANYKKRRLMEWSSAITTLETLEASASETNTKVQKAHSRHVLPISLRFIFQIMLAKSQGYVVQIVSTHQAITNMLM